MRGQWSYDYDMHDHQHPPPAAGGPQHEILLRPIDIQELLDPFISRAVYNPEALDTSLRLPSLRLATAELDIIPTLV